jgi:hypothetical protein
MGDTKKLSFIEDSDEDNEENFKDERYNLTKKMRERQIEEERKKKGDKPYYEEITRGKLLVKGIRTRKRHRGSN